MRILITGICGFVGSALARSLRTLRPDTTITGIDSLWRPGSELNRSALRSEGFGVVHGDVRTASDLDALPPADWVIDAAANASVLAGVDGQTSGRQLVEHNLYGTVNILEYCRRHSAGLVLLSSSRVYSIRALLEVPLEERDGAFHARAADQPVRGYSPHGIAEGFSTDPPVSLYGASKLASEQLALEYGAAFGFPVWIDRCGVLAGPGQFGQPAQGIFAYWINAWLRKRPLRYIGYGGTGVQVRDCLHPSDLARLVNAQLDAREPRPGAPAVVNVSGGVAGARSLAQLSSWCAERFGGREIGREAATRAFDVPWVVLDCARAATHWDWRPAIPPETIFEEIADHADRHPDWLERSGV
ncbi:MAG: NAD-dependent epimerase/dehydratase family protein [Gemmatimonadales bacterium]